MPTPLRLASVFSDHMVLCRNRIIRIFGEADSGREITVHLQNHTASCTAVKSQFEALLPPMPHGGPYAMTVSDGISALTFQDILIGDVFFAGGQSNMEMCLMHTQDGARTTAEADYPLIRYCNFPVQPFLDAKTLERESKTSWRIVKPGRSGEISAVAFHFAVKLHAEIGVTIGIIGCYLGGTSITSWLDEAALSSVQGGKEYLEAYLERIKGLTDDAYIAALKTQTRASILWYRKANAIKAKKPSAKWDDLIAALGPCPWPPPEGRMSAYRPCGLVNTMVKRIAPYTITGFLYYQGESDYRHPHLYRALMTALVSSWRDLFMNPDLPFLFVQLPMFEQRLDSLGDSWAILRQVQEQVYMDMRNTGLAVMIDGGDPEDIHPKDKKTVGERLCLQAQNVIYHKEIDGDSPRATAARPAGNAMIVDVSAPLRHEKTPRLFEVAGEDMVFHRADALIGDMEIRLSSPKVARPRFTRYAWVNYGQVNVFGENGLPLAPFSLH